MRVSPKLSADRVSALALLTFSLGYSYLAANIALFPGGEHQVFTARTLPIGLSVCAVLVSLALLIQSFLTAGAVSVDNVPLRWSRGFALCALMVFFGMGIPRLGFIFSSGLFLAAALLVMGERRVYVVLAVVLSITVTAWFLLGYVLDMYLEPGLLGEILG